LENALNIAEEQFSHFCHEINVKEKLMDILSKNIPVSMHCSLTQTILLSMVADKFIIEWCNFLNKILNGKIKDGFETNYVLSQAKKISERYCKNKGNKIIY